MEAVRAFNNELSALYEGKPPISRAKMAQLTKCAIKAIKFYKHVVQSVEKFIQKCKPEYKVPGLYVIDSVVRQSRHQFGSHKDVFAPRFTKNIIVTFQNLFKCPGEERSKIVRVLNLWQKNEVFPSEIIQPLLDLAADPTKPSAIAAVQAAVDRVMAASGKPTSSSQPQPPPSQPPAEATAPEEPPQEALSQAAAESMLATQNDMLNTVTQLLQQTDSGNTSLSAQQQQLQQLQLLQQQLIQQTQLMQQPSGAGPIIDSNLLAQIQTLTNQLLAKTETKPDGGGFNTKLLDFDYGESDDEEDRRQHNDTNVAGNVQTILNDSSLMQQIHQMSQTIQKTEQLKTELSEQEKRRRILEQQQAEFDQQISQSHPPPPPFVAQPPAPEDTFREEGEYEEELLDEDFRDHHQLRDRDDRDSRRDRRRRSRERSRTPKRRRRSRSRSRERSKEHRRRSRSKDRDRHRARSKDQEREKQKERERDRKKKALPPLRGNSVTICTTTIWIGHLNKFTQEEELKTELEHYGPVESISMVPPRGCAYVVMCHRKDAFKAIDRLKGYKLNGSALKTAWAQSKGMRESDYKDGWDVDNGSMYIPWDKLPGELSQYLEGGIIDPDSLPQHLKDIPTEKSKVEEQAANVQMPQGQNNTQINMGQQPPPMPGQPPMMGMMPPQPGQMPPGMPAMMQNMMMQMQRPMGMPPPNMPMPPGAPPQPMMPGTAQIPLPGVRPGAPVNAMNPMSIANTAANTLAQNIQNIMASSAGTLGSNSPAIPPRPGFPPGSPARFGFNPNMPPPGFRMPPPGFGGPIRPMMPNMTMNKPPTEPGKMGERPPLLDSPVGPKQPGMAWPPDSNEKDEDNDDDEDENMEGNDKPAVNNGNSVGQFGPSFLSQQNIRPGSQDQSPMRMLGPRPPGGFPPGGPPGAGNQWNMMRMGGPRNMRPPMGENRMGGQGPNIRPPVGLNNQDMFNSPRPSLLGMGGGPRFMGNMPPGIAGGPGFPRFPGGPGGTPSNAKGPVSLLDLDLKPPEGFQGQTFKDDEEPMEDNNMDLEENNIDDSNENLGEKESENFEGNNDEEVEESKNVYPFNIWQTVSKGNNRNRDRSSGHDRQSRDDRIRDRDEDRNRNRDDDRSRNRDDRSRDRNNSRDRDRNNSRDRDRNDSRDRDRHRDRERERDRDRGDSWRRRDDRKDRDGPRRDRDRGSHSSRWSNVEDDNTTKNNELETAQIQASGDKSDNQVEESTNNSIDKPEKENENAESIPPTEDNAKAVLNNDSENTADVQNNIEADNVDAIISDKVENDKVENETVVSDEKIQVEVSGENKDKSSEVISSEIESGEVVNDEIESDQLNDNAEKTEVSEEVNGPSPETHVTPNKVETLKVDIPPQTDSNDNVDKENVDLEEGEISS